jgi:hypothetical protein
VSKTSECTRANTLTHMFFLPEGYPRCAPGDEFLGRLPRSDIHGSAAHDEHTRIVAGGATPNVVMGGVTPTAATAGVALETGPNGVASATDHTASNAAVASPNSHDPALKTCALRVFILFSCSSARFSCSYRCMRGHLCRLSHGHRSSSQSLRHASQSSNSCHGRRKHCST